MSQAGTHRGQGTVSAFVQPVLGRHHKPWVRRHTVAVALAAATIAGSAGGGLSSALSRAPGAMALAAGHASLASEPQVSGVFAMVKLAGQEHVVRVAAAQATRRAAALRFQVPAPSPQPVPVVPGPPAPSGGVVLSAAQIGALWVAQGGSPAAEQVAVCIAEHESGGNTQAVSPTDDWGLFQINQGGPAMLNAAANTRRAIEMSSNGTNWSAWTTASACGAPMSAGARPLATTLPRRLRAYDFAMAQRGCAYIWAAAGPCRDGYDCSGLVMAAWWHAGVGLPHNTVAMIDSGKLVRTSYPRRGDIVMFFSGGTAVHAGIVVYKSRWMVDAPEPGTVVHVERIADWSGVWHAFYRVR